MTTRKECDCIENAVRAMALATEMKDFSFFYIQTGRDPELKDMYVGTPYEIKPPKGAKHLIDRINTNASLLDKELKGLEKNCKIELLRFYDEKKYDYIEGKAALSEAIKNKGRSLGTSYMAGTKISNGLQDMASRKKLVLCSD